MHFLKFNMQNQQQNDYNLAFNSYHFLLYSFVVTYLYKWLTQQHFHFLFKRKKYIHIKLELFHVCTMAIGMLLESVYYTVAVNQHARGYSTPISPPVKERRRCSKFVIVVFLESLYFYIPTHTKKKYHCFSSWDSGVIETGCTIQTHQPKYSHFCI